MEKKRECLEMTEEGYREGTVRYPEPDGGVLYRWMAFDGLFIGYGDPDHLLSVLPPGIDGIKIDYLKEEAGDLTGEEPAELPRYFEAHISEDFFLKIFPYKNFSFRHLKEEVESVVDPRRTGYAAAQLIRDIVSCRHESWLKRLFMGTKVIELLFDRIGPARYKFPDREGIKGENVEKLYRVKEYLFHNLRDPLTLAELAHKAGTNEFTLKKGFREVFGTPVFTFWTNVKMEKAKELLETTDLNVSEVAEKVGYKNPQHFSTAFKRKYSVLPSSLKK